MRTVLIAAFDGAGSEPEALRQVLEVYGYFVVTRYIARPKDLIEVLRGNLPISFDYLILSCHGEDGSILMPQLHESVYEAEEPRGNFTASHIRKYCLLTRKTILSLGCTTGQTEMSKAFAASNTYIGPVDYISGSSALMYALRFFYETEQNQKATAQAHRIAMTTDRETAQFHLAE